MNVDIARQTPPSLRSRPSPLGEEREKNLKYFLSPKEREREKEEKVEEEEGFLEHCLDF